MSDPEPEPLIQRNFAPELPHFGKHFVYHGRSDVLTFRIDVQHYTHDGHVIVGGTILHETETYPNGVKKDLRGEQLSVFVTESEYMCLSNAPMD